MLARLRHYAFVRGDHEHNKIDTARPREHVLDEAFMPRNIDKAKPNVAGLHLSKTEIDRNTPFFFFGKPIGVRARQRLYERRLSVIDVPGGADDDVHKKLA